MFEVIIYITALVASGLTLISGFGLGTLMLPVFAIFFPMEIAIGMTAVVHLINNIFKFGLIYKWVNWRVALIFGGAGVVGAFFGAKLMLNLEGLESLYTNEWIDIRPLHATIGLLMVLFAYFELNASLKAFHPELKFLIPGGVLSGFFGGLSGHQGALRSMFLLKSGLSKTAYVASGTTIALMVDLTRIPIYINKYSMSFIEDNIRVILLATIFAFLGAYIGKRYIEKVTFRAVQIIVGIFMIFIGIGLIIGKL